MVSSQLFVNESGGRRVIPGHDTPSAPPDLPFTPLRLAEADARLDRAVRAGNGHTVLVCAPAGSGKTVLVADWIRRRHANTPVGWVGLGDAAADPDRLWPAVADALRLPVVSRPNAVPDTPVDDAAALLSALAARPGRTVLVIDDAHLINDPLTLSGLEYFVEHAPRQLITVVLGRYDPPIRWHALEMTARLTRVSAPELRFDESHTAALLAQHDCRLTASELSGVHELTCGWAGLVRIAAIDLAARTGDRETAIAALAQGPRAVADFLVGELLTTLPAEAREFLLATAVPDSFCAELAAVLAGPAAARMLEHLLRNNFPVEVTAHDGVLWYTYHPMLRTYLLAEAGRADPDRIAELHRECAGWFVATALLPAALRHVLAEPGHPALPGFVRAHGPRMVFDGNGAALFRALDHIDAPADDPFVLLLRTADAIEHGDVVQATALRELIAERPQRDSVFVPPELLRPFTLAVVHDVTAGTTDAPGPVPPVPPATGHLDLDCYIALQIATAHTFAADAGQRGEPGLRHALALSERAGLHRLTLHALTRLAMAAGLGGSLALMRERAFRAVAFADHHRLHDTASLAHARVMVALMAYLQADDHYLQAAEILPRTTRLDGSTAPASGWHADVLAHLFTFDTAPDRHAVADTLRNAMHRLLEETPVPATTGGLLAHVTWALLRLRRHDTAQQLLDRAVTTLGRLPETTLVEAALADYHHRSTATVELIEPLLRQEENLHPVSAVHAWLLRAAADHRLDRSTAAYEALHRALALAYTDRLIRPFLDVPGTLGLLDQFVGRFGHLDEFVDTIRHRPRTRATARLPHLTDTELAVLRQLPSGMTTHSLAADMGVSINTVKTHLRGIYHKLGVRTRADAIAHGRNFGLI
ncbi:LuxR C-terminal-related transcriptional regulator [Nocardia wallacei]|uniref:LuxR C-terminal-related transcriptional regulator n=1 Tax=Nocardia wallacei TaxID=480035 RepID=UPI002454ED8B|nr:LuxR C-terminal-related transcriptional regulator [Nocardia wallacei]